MCVNDLSIATSNYPWMINYRIKAYLAPALTQWEPPHVFKMQRACGTHTLTHTHVQHYGGALEPNTKCFWLSVNNGKRGVAYLHITPLLKQRLSWNYIYMTRTYKRGNFRYGFPSGSTICQVINASTQVLCCTASLHP